MLTCGPPRSREKRKRRGREGNPFSFDRGHVQRRYFSEARGGREKKKSSSFPPFLFFLMTDLGKMKWSRWRRRRKKRSLEEEEEATSFLSSSSPTQRENLVRRRRRKGCWSVLPQEMGDGRKEEGRKEEFCAKVTLVRAISCSACTKEEKDEQVRKRPREHTVEL